MGPRINPIDVQTFKPDLTMARLRGGDGNRFVARTAGAPLDFGPEDQWRDSGQAVMIEAILYLLYNPRDGH